MPTPAPSEGFAAPVGRTVRLPPLGLIGELTTPERPRGLVIFAHGSGSSRLSPRNRWVAAALVEAGFGALLFDLLTEAEAAHRANVFDVDLLGERLAQVIDWAGAQPQFAGVPLGLFGASTGAAAALKAAAARPGRVSAILSRGGRPDLALDVAGQVAAPTLLIVGGRDEPVLTWNRQAARALAGPARVEVVASATHLFEEPGALDEVVRLAIAWFDEHLAASAPNEAAAR